MYRIVVAEQDPATFHGYRLEDFDDKDAAAIREGRMVLAAIVLERRRDGVWVREAEKINLTVPADVVGEYPHFEEIADKETRFWASDMWGDTLEAPAGAKALWGRLMSLCTVVETETEPYELGLKHTGYVLIRGSPRSWSRSRPTRRAPPLDWPRPRAERGGAIAIGTECRPTTPTATQGTPSCTGPRCRTALMLVLACGGTRDPWVTGFLGEDNGA